MSNQTHNLREQRRARRINDKITQLKGFLEFQGRAFKGDKYSILDAACVQLQFLYEQLVEAAPLLGWHDPHDELRRRTRSARAAVDFSGSDDDEAVVSGSKRSRAAVRTDAAQSTAPATAQTETKTESFVIVGPHAEAVPEDGPRETKRLRSQVRPYCTYSVLEPAYFQHLIFSASLPCAVVDAGAFHTFASPAYCDLFNIQSLSGPVGVNLTSLVSGTETERVGTLLTETFSRFTESKLRKPAREPVVVSLVFIIGGVESQRDVVISSVPGGGKFPDFVFLTVLPTSAVAHAKPVPPKRVPRPVVRPQPLVDSAPVHDSKPSPRMADPGFASFSDKRSGIKSYPGPVPAVDVGNGHGMHAMMSLAAAHGSPMYAGPIHPGYGTPMDASGMYGGPPGPYPSPFSGGSSGGMMPQGQAPPSAYGPTGHMSSSYAPQMFSGMPYDLMSPQGHMPQLYPTAYSHGGVAGPGLPGPTGQQAMSQMQAQGQRYYMQFGPPQSTGASTTPLQALASAMAYGDYSGQQGGGYPPNSADSSPR